MLALLPDGVQTFETDATHEREFVRKEMVVSSKAYDLRVVCAQAAPQLWTQPNAAHPSFPPYPSCTLRGE